MQRYNVEGVNKILFQCLINSLLVVLKPPRDKMKQVIISSIDLYLKDVCLFQGFLRINRHLRHKRKPFIHTRYLNVPMAARCNTKHTFHPHLFVEARNKRRDLNASIVFRGGSRQGSLLRYLDTTGARLSASSFDYSVVLIHVYWQQGRLNKWAQGVSRKNGLDIHDQF